MLDRVDESIRRDVASASLCLCVRGDLAHVQPSRSTPTVSVEITRNRALSSVVYVQDEADINIFFPAHESVDSQEQTRQQRPNVPVWSLTCLVSPFGGCPQRHPPSSVPSSTSAAPATSSPPPPAERAPRHFSRQARSPRRVTSATSLPLLPPPPSPPPHPLTPPPPRGPARIAQINRVGAADHTRPSSDRAPPHPSPCTTSS